jgi:acetolactate decarboxylase
MASLPYQRHDIFQVSVMSALLDGVYDGEMTIAELLGHGDFGLGTVDALDGELLILDGSAHQLHVDGGVELADPAVRTPFAVITTFLPHITHDVTTRTTGAEFAELLSSLVPSQNYLYAVRVSGRFELVRTRTVARQARPYRPLVEVTKGQEVRQLDDVVGVMAGFRTPLYERGIGVPGGHVHFIDADHRRGGHVLDFVVERATLDICVGSDLHLALPMTPEFAHALLDPVDEQEQIERTER